MVRGAAAAVLLALVGLCGSASAAAPLHYPHAFSQTGVHSTAWATVLRRTRVFASPSTSARVVTISDPTVAASPSPSRRIPDVLLVLGGVETGPSETWYHVRLARLPNGSTGWVPRDALSAIATVDTHLYLDRRTLTLTLERDGVTIFATRVGIGEPYWPTPSGQYFVRGKLADFDNPFYGPLVIETSACSTILTEWPDGPCMVGIQGTNEPRILPGRVSHGEIRMLNQELLRLAPLVPLGTPLTIT